jgi:hypothetical protein
MTASPLPTYPADSVQAVVAPWWEKKTDATIQRGSLIWGFVPYVGLTPRTLEVTGRTEATSHDKATFKLAAMSASNPPRAPKLPVAAMPHIPGEVWAVYRAKRRPMVVLSLGGTDLPPEIQPIAAKWQRQGMLIAAPYFGAEPDGDRAGWKPEFVIRIKHCEYPQYFYDKLPLSGSTSESILRLDQLQPIGKHHNSWSPTDWRLSTDALVVLDEWLVWLFTGKLDPNGVLNVLRNGIREIAAPISAA